MAVCYFVIIYFTLLGLPFTLIFDVVSMPALV